MAIDREKVLAAAQKYVEKKKYDRAVIEYQRIIQEDPNDARTLLKMGDLQSKMEAYADAVVTYERVGKFYASQGFSLKAIAVYKQIREIIARYVPQLEDTYSHITPKLAELYQQLGLTSDALATLDEVATRLQRQNRDQEAIGVFRKIVELDPTNPLPHLRLAEALSHAKDADGAVAEFGAASGQLLKLGRRDDALKVIERLLHHKPDAAYARTAAEVYLARNIPNDGMKALAKLQICFQANPRDLDTLGLLARAFTQIGQAAKAIEVQKEMARIARDTGKTELYRELVAKLVKIAPNDEGVRRLATGSEAPIPASTVPPRASPKAEPEPDAEIEQSDASYEDVGEGDFEPEEQPIALARRSAPTEPDSEVIVESGVDVVEEVGDPPTAGGAHEHVARVLGDAATFRRARLYNKAVETLRVGLTMAPKALEVHEMLRDVLLEAGRTHDASTEMVQIASLLVEFLDGDAAARALQEALALDPDNTTASDMLRELGYELVEEPQPESEEAQSAHAEPPPTRHSSYDPEAPLPAYELDEVDIDDRSARTDVGQDPHRSIDPRVDPSEPSLGTVAVANPTRGEMDEIDDPFDDAPLPSYPLDPAPESESPFELVGDENAGVATQPPQPRNRAPSAPPVTLELESALEEAEFFLSRGLFDDARTILMEQLARLPNNSLLLERIAELEAQERSLVGGSGTRPSPAAADAEGDRAFDIAESLGALEEDRVSGIGPGGGSGAPTEQVDVEEVFAKFKAGVAQQISVDDTQSHYDLGVAYKEMGLLDDAIREFDVAARDPKRECVCHSMVGMIQIERGNINEAIDAFTRGLHAPDRSKEQEAALCYEIGAAYEAKKMVKPALDHFQRTARLVPSYRDVQERVRRLQKVEPKQPVRAVAVGADDEFDRAFDDILAGRKLP